MTSIVIPKISRCYKPTAGQWLKINNYTEFTTGDFIPHSKVELINFKTSKVHLKDGKRVGFDCLNEHQYVRVCNGGFYEDAPLIADTDRI